MGGGIHHNLLSAFMFSSSNCEPITPMDFNGMFGGEVEESDENSSDGYCGRYYASDDEGEEDEGGEDCGGEEGDPTGGREDKHGNFSGGASHARDGGKIRPIVAEDFLGREFVGEEDAYLAYKEFARTRGFGVRKGDVGRVDGVLVRRNFFATDKAQDILSTMTVLSELGRRGWSELTKHCICPIE